MKLIQSTKLAALAVTLALAATPAFAQHDQDRGNRGGERQGQAQQRGENRGGENRGGQARARGGENRGQSQARGEDRGGQARENRGGEARGTAGRAEGENRGNEGARRGYAVPRTDNYRSRAYVEPRAYGYGRPHADIRIRHYDRPYFFFRPRFLLGYGLYVGYPVPYPVMYGPPTYVYGYPYGAPVTVQPNDYGGISLDIDPPDAEVSVDGADVGIAGDFSPSYQPLTLTPGRHHIELQAAGMVPLAFDVDVQPGQVIPYRGTLQPQ